MSALLDDLDGQSRAVRPDICFDKREPFDQDL